MCEPLSPDALREMHAHCRAANDLRRTGLPPQPRLRVGLRQPRADGPKNCERRCGQDIPEVREWSWSPAQKT